MQVNLQALTFEQSDDGQFIASAGTYHVGYGKTKADAVSALMWSMVNE